MTLTRFAAAAALGAVALSLATSFLGSPTERMSAQRVLSQLTVGMSRDAVDRKFGEPEREKRQGETRYYEYRTSDGFVLIVFGKDRVVSFKVGQITYYGP